MSFAFFLLLAGLVWIGLRGEIGLGAFATGAVLGAAFWRIERARSRLAFAPGRAVRLSAAGLRVFALFLWEILVANAQQLRVVLAPRIRLRPHWVRFSTRLESPALRALLGVMVSLTPGTLICDEVEREDGGLDLFIHVLDAEDPSGTVERIRDRLETPLRALETP